MIFTSTDVIVNIGVMAAGALVYFTASNLPDLIMSTLVFVLVGVGSYYNFFVIVLLKSRNCA